VCFFNALKPEFKAYQQRVLGNAVEFAESFARLGYRIVSGGTDNHLVLVDLQPKGISGRKAEKLLESIGIVVNRNVIPNDSLPAEVTSGIRIGSPAMTTRGMGKKEARRVVELMDKALVNAGEEKVLNRIADQVRELCRQFPVYSSSFHEP
jgi:glycine hydroxymethyltransferase